MPTCSDRRVETAMTTTTLSITDILLTANLSLTTFIRREEEEEEEEAEEEKEKESNRDPALLPAIRWFSARRSLPFLS